MRASGNPGPFGRSVRSRAVGVACCVLLSACAGGNENDDRPTPGASAASSTTLTTSLESVAATPPSGVTTPTGRGSGPAPYAGPSPPGRPPSTSSAIAAPATPEPAPAHAGGAAPGKYVYDVSGTTSAGLTPAQQDVRGRSVLTVEPMHGQDQRSTSVSDLSSRPPVEQVLRFLAAGVYLVRLEVGGGFKEFAPNPPVLAAPTPPAAAPWSWKIVSTDGTTELAGSFRYSRTETLPVGDRSVRAHVVEGELRFTGAIVGTITVTRWFSVADSLDVKSHEVTDFTAPAPSRDDLTSVLRSLAPG